MLLPRTSFAVLTTVPGWATVRTSAYGASVGAPARGPGPKQTYRATGLSPMRYESTGKRRDGAVSDGAVSREGNVELRRALIDLGVDLWLSVPAAKAHAAGLRARGKKGGVIACALAHRANRIADVLVRDQHPYDATRWTPEAWPGQPFRHRATGCRLVGDEGPEQTPLRLWRTPRLRRN